MTTLKELSDMSGRRVLITGGAGYIGQVMAETLAELGASIVLLDRPGAQFGSIQTDLMCHWNANCLCIECDLESEEERNSAIQEIKSDGKGLNCLINNAAFGGTTALEGWVTPFETQSLSTWRRALEVNLTAPFHFSQAFTPELRLAKGGNIINVTSIYGELGPDWRLYEGTEMGSPAAYGASKGGLAQLTRWLATTLAPEVRVNAISPGGVFRNQPKVFIQRYESRTPLQRMATEDDFRGVIAYLASDQSAFVSGQIISVDGAWGVW
jgi:NAD(P)-dependent dehydrogenase (short-subunit alcohol dehydrogenase family)